MHPEKAFQHCELILLGEVKTVEKQMWKKNVYETEKKELNTFLGGKKSLKKKWSSSPK